jgi:hypothetical protein
VPRSSRCFVIKRHPRCLRHDLTHHSLYSPHNFTVAARHTHDTNRCIQSTPSTPDTTVVCLPSANHQSRSKIVPVDHHDFVNWSSLFFCRCSHCRRRSRSASSSHHNHRLLLRPPRPPSPQESRKRNWQEKPHDGRYRCREKRACCFCNSSRQPSQPDQQEYLWYTSTFPSVQLRTSQPSSASCAFTTLVPPIKTSLSYHHSLNRREKGHK